MNWVLTIRKVIVFDLTMMHKCTIFSAISQNSNYDLQIMKEVRAAQVTLTEKSRYVTYLHDVMLPMQPSRLTLWKKQQKAEESHIIEQYLGLSLLTSMMSHVAKRCIYAVYIYKIQLAD